MMGMATLRNRVDQLETSSGMNVTRNRVVLVPHGSDRKSTIAAAGIQQGENLTVVMFVAPGDRI